MPTKKRSTTKKKTPQGSGRPRELIDTGRDKRFVRRDEKGRFDEVVDMGRSIAMDKKRTSKTVAKPGYGDQGDLPPKPATRSKKSGAKKRGK